MNSISIHAGTVYAEVWQLHLACGCARVQKRVMCRTTRIDRESGMRYVSGKIATVGCRECNRITRASTISTGSEILESVSGDNDSPAAGAIAKTALIRGSRCDLSNPFSGAA